MLPHVRPLLYRYLTVFRAESAVQCVPTVSIGAMACEPDAHLFTN